MKRFIGLLLALLLPGLAAAQTPPPVVTIMRTPLIRPAPCTGAFIAHDLPHTTTTADGVIRMYQANGAGMAVADLDGDGDLDLVLGAEAGENSLLWNDGALRFRKTTLGQGPTRMVSAVDVDADGRIDLVLTTNTGAVQYWRNMGDGDFQRRVLPGVAQPAYVIAWADLDRDGDPDLVTGAYDAGFLTDRGSEYLVGPGSGVFVYENRGDSFAVAAQLADEAQALALAVTDLNGDGLDDLLVGNDFDVPDYVFLQTGSGLGPDGWRAAEPFAVTTHSTMSLDLADVNNDGRMDIFAGDMKPVNRDTATLAAWIPLMQAGYERRRYRDLQRNENVLQRADGTGDYANLAYRLGLDATGWTWSAKFGDLDNDGLLDLYAVNGMIEAEIFAGLPNHELVEANQVRRNLGNRFAPGPEEWGLGSTRSGRSMVMADLDQDGDLDIVVNNLRAPAQLFENRVCGGDGLLVDLAWPGSANPAALGAQVRLETDAGAQLRLVIAQSGYLSSGPTQLHFGPAAGATPRTLVITWPDGAQTRVEDIAVHERVQVVRTSN